VKIRLLFSILIGISLSAIPMILTSLPGNAPLLDKLQQASSVLLLPSFPLSMLMSGGNIHDSNLWVMGTFDACFYAVAVYVILAWLAKRRSKREKSHLSGDIRDR
jgi:hypothetical protein